MVTVTMDLLRAGESGNGGWNAKQLRLLGLNWPPRQGWMALSVGLLLTQEEADEFVRLKGKTKKKCKANGSNLFAPHLRSTTANKIQVR